MIASVREGVEKYKATLKEHIKRTHESDAVAFRIRHFAQRPEDDLSNAELIGMEKALGLSEQEVKEIQAECGLGR